MTLKDLCPILDKDDLIIITKYYRTNIIDADDLYESNDDLLSLEVKWIDGKKIYLE